MSYLLLPVIFLGKFAPEGHRIFHRVLVHLLIVLARLDASPGFILSLHKLLH